MNEHSHIHALRPGALIEELKALQDRAPDSPVIVTTDNGEHFHVLEVYVGRRGITLDAIPFETEDAP